MVNDKIERGLFTRRIDPRHQSTKTTPTKPPTSSAREEGSRSKSMTAIPAGARVCAGEIQRSAAGATSGSKSCREARRLHYAAFDLHPDYQAGSAREGHLHLSGDARRCSANRHMA